MLLDQFVPEYHFHEIHATTVRASPERVFQAIGETTTADLAVMRALFAIRLLPTRLAGQRQIGQTSLMARPLLQLMLEHQFIVLDEAPGRELVVGTVGQFWRLTGGTALRLNDAREFVAVAEPRYAKAAFNFILTDYPAGYGVNLRTETRISVPHPATRKQFARYWRVIAPGSALIRLDMLRAIKRRAEQRAWTGV